VPRPLAVAAGAPPPWSAHGLEDPVVTFETVRQALRDAHVEQDERAISAVLVPLVAHEEEVAVILTRRAAELVRDPGNMSFPGGRLDPGESALECALREAYEEIGLDPGAVEVIGTLATVTRRSDAEVVSSFVGLVSGRPRLVASADEVEEIIEVRLSDLLREGVAWEEHWGEGAHARPIRFFASTPHLGSDVIWGLTARVLWDLLERIALVMTTPSRDR
jgi:8-oxo-dGTP pyrophosphatase MutT (NUDIX family)